MGWLAQFKSIYRSRFSAQKQPTTNATAIAKCEQSLVKAYASITEAKKQLASFMAQRMLLQGRNKTLRDKINRKKQQAALALKYQQDTQAHTLAEDIIEYEKLLNQQSQLLQTLTAREKKLKSEVQINIQNVQFYQQELQLVKTTQHLQKCKLQLRTDNQISLKQALIHIKQQQQTVDDKFTAQQQLAVFDDDDLKQRLNAAGIVTN